MAGPSRSRSPPLFLTHIETEGPPSPPDRPSLAAVSRGAASQHFLQPDVSSLAVEDKCAPWKCSRGRRSQRRDGFRPCLRFVAARAVVSMNARTHSRRHRDSTHSTENATMHTRSRHDTRRRASTYQGRGDAWVAHQEAAVRRAGYPHGRRSICGIHPGVGAENGDCRRLDPKSWSLLSLALLGRAQRPSAVMKGGPPSSPACRLRAERRSWRAVRDEGLLGVLPALYR
jgi:hypothetical protein